MLNRFVYTLKQPHPGYQDLRVYFRTVLGISLLVFLILSIGQPFDIKQRNILGNPYITAAVYAGGAALAMSFNSVWMLLFPQWYQLPKWTLAKQLIVVIYQFASIALVIWLINHIRGNLPSQDATLSKSFFLAIAVGAFPYCIATFGRHNYLLRYHLKEAMAFNKQVQTATKCVEQKETSAFLKIAKLDTPVMISQFLFAESQGNHLIIQTVKENKPVCYTLRSTLNDFAASNNHISELFRCHRSFIINMDKIIKVQGNAAGYQVLLHKELSPVVVARSNVALFKKKLAGITTSVMD